MERISEDTPFCICMPSPGLCCSAGTESLQSQVRYDRAIHLELTLNLNVPSFLLAFRRFVGRHGLPNTLLLDNAKIFRAASKEVCAIIRAPEVLQYFTIHQISWKFIAERAPGGGVLGKNGLNC